MPSESELMAMEAGFLAYPVPQQTPEQVQAAIASTGLLVENKPFFNWGQGSTYAAPTVNQLMQMAGMGGTPNIGNLLPLVAGVAPGTSLVSLGGMGQMPLGPGAIKSGITTGQTVIGKIAAPVAGVAAAGGVAYGISDLAGLLGGGAVSTNTDLMTIFNALGGTQGVANILGAVTGTPAGAAGSTIGATVVGRHRGFLQLRTATGKVIWIKTAKRSRRHRGGSGFPGMGQIMKFRMMEKLIGGK